MSTRNDTHRASVKEVWIGLVSVVARPDNSLLGKAKKGFVNALAFVGSASEYRTAIEHALDELGMDAEEIEDVERLSERVSKWTVAPKILELADEVRSTYSVRFGSFHVSESD